MRTFLECSIEGTEMGVALHSLQSRLRGSQDGIVNFFEAPPMPLNDPMLRTHLERFLRQEERKDDELEDIMIAQASMVRRCEDTERPWRPSYTPSSQLESESETMRLTFVPSFADSRTRTAFRKDPWLAITNWVGHKWWPTTPIRLWPASWRTEIRHHQICHVATVEVFGRIHYLKSPAALMLERSGIEGVFTDTEPSTAFVTDWAPRNMNEHLHLDDQEYFHRIHVRETSPQPRGITIHNARLGCRQEAIREDSDIREEQRHRRTTLAADEHIELFTRVELSEMGVNPHDERLRNDVDMDSEDELIAERRQDDWMRNLEQWCTTHGFWLNFDSMLCGHDDMQARWLRPWERTATLQFVPTNDGELALEPGDHVTIAALTRRGSHALLNRWVHGTNHRSKAQGWFPIRFTRPRPAPGHESGHDDAPHADADQAEEWRPANTTGHLHGPAYSSDMAADGPPRFGNPTWRLDVCEHPDLEYQETHHEEEGRPPNTSAPATWRKTRSSFLWEKITRRTTSPRIADDAPGGASAFAYPGIALAHGSRTTLPEEPVPLRIRGCPPRCIHLPRTVQELLTELVDDPRPLLQWRTASKEQDSRCTARLARLKRKLRWWKSLRTTAQGVAFVRCFDTNGYVARYRPRGPLRTIDEVYIDDIRTTELRNRNWIAELQTRRYSSSRISIHVQFVSFVCQCLHCLHNFSAWSQPLAVRWRHYIPGWPPVRSTTGRGGVFHG